MTGPSITLWAYGLATKRGFNDGDMPEKIADFVGWEIEEALDWHRVLIDLVERYLVPALDQTVVVHTMEGSHNPVRLESVDGVHAYPAIDQDPYFFELTPEEVVVPWSAIVQSIRDSGYTGPLPVAGSNSESAQ